MLFKKAIAPAARAREGAARDPAQPNEVWSADIMSDALWSGRRMTADWIKRYHESRTHESLGDLTPRQYLMANSPEPSTSKWSGKRGGLHSIKTRRDGNQTCEGPRQRY